MPRLFVARVGKASSQDLRSVKMKGGLNMLLLARLAGKQKPHDGFVRGSKDAEQGREGM